MHNDDIPPARASGSPALPDASIRPGIRPSVHLTPRESQIVRFVILGESNKQIARRLGISDYTVRDHVSNLLRKAGAAKRSRLAMLLSPAPVPPDTTIRLVDPASIQQRKTEVDAGPSRTGQGSATR
jgi:DNA-binding CsgD family transcriptional regulator